MELRWKSFQGKRYYLCHFESFIWNFRDSELVTRNSEKGIPSQSGKFEFPRFSDLYKIACFNSYFIWNLGLISVYNDHKKINAVLWIINE